MKILVLTVGVSLTAPAQSRDSVTVKNEIAQLELKISQEQAKILQAQENLKLLLADSTLVNDSITWKLNKITQLENDSAILKPQFVYTGVVKTALDGAIHGWTGAYWTIYSTFFGTPITFLDSVFIHMKTSDTFAIEFGEGFQAYYNLVALRDSCVRMLALHDSLEYLRNKLPALYVRQSDNALALPLARQDLADLEQALQTLNEELADLYAELEEIRKNAGTGIEQLTMDNVQLKIYPNPAGNQLQITNYELRENAYIEIYSVVGQRLTLTTLTSLPTLMSLGQATIDVSGLPSGIYFLKIDNKVVKFIKE